MVTGIDTLKKYFKGFESEYVIIGGTACDLLMAEEGLDFRATKDIDMVLIVEALTAEFGRKFWDFIISAGYEHCNKSSGTPQFYRFSKPKDHSYPFMIELFSHKTDIIQLANNAVLTPLHIDDSVSSLSAILLNENYYQCLRSGIVQIDGVPILGAPHLIAFKAKAWVDLSTRQANGEHVDSKNIKKHKNDIFRLSALLVPNQTITVPQSILSDLHTFIKAMHSEDVDLKALKISGSKSEILSHLSLIYTA